MYKSLFVLASSFLWALTLCAQDLAPDTFVTTAAADQPGQNCYVIGKAFTLSGASFKNFDHLLTGPGVKGLGFDLGHQMNSFLGAEFNFAYGTGTVRDVHKSSPTQPNDFASTYQTYGVSILFGLEGERLAARAKFSFMNEGENIGPVGKNQTRWQTRPAYAVVLGYNLGSKDELIFEAGGGFYEDALLSDNPKSYSFHLGYKYGFGK